MVKKRATIYDVAERASVSTATVSRVLNESPLVSDKTREKVHQVIEELGFSPQLTAQKLAGGSAQTLAVVVPSFTTPYFNEVLKGIKDVVMKTDLDMVLTNTGSKTKEERMQMFFDRRMADAVIILSINVTEKVHWQLQATKTPAVLINSAHPDYTFFELNDYYGGFLAGSYLADQGFETIGMISTMIDTKITNDRKLGFVEALENKQVAIDEDYFVSGDTRKHDGFTEEGGYEAIQKYEELGHFPEAIFCMDDTQALGAMHALRKLGIRIPEDIAVMGYDNIKMSKYLDLTTVDQKMHSIGANAAEKLLEMINRPDQTSIYQEKIDPVLVERGSTKKTM